MGLVSFLKSAESRIAGMIKGAAKAEPMAAAIVDVGLAAAGFAEFVPMVNKIGSVLVSAGGVVNAVQGSSGTGASKLAVAAPLIDNLVRSSGFLSDKVIADEQKWSAAIQSMTSSFADLLNSVASKPSA